MVVEILLRIVVFAFGLLIVVQTFLSAVKTFVMPRAANVWLTRQVFRRVNWFFQLRVRRVNSYEERDGLMAMFAPITLLTLPVVWLVLTGFGYMFMFRAVGISTWTEAFRLSGSSLLTLGIAAPPDLFTSFLTFTEATLGLILVALLIAYLPTMYATFSKREAAVSLLEVRAGQPPSAIEMIERAHRIRGLEVLDDIFAQWEMWFVELEETHTTFGGMVFFRSPQPGRSWVTAAGTVLDAAALMTSTVDVPRNAQRDLCIRAGFLALRSLADYYRIWYDPEPKSDDPISITREEFDAAYDQLLAAGVPLKPDRDDCWVHYAGWRVNYDRVLLAMALLTMAPYAQWISDRSLPDMGPGSALTRQRRMHEARW